MAHTLRGAFYSKTAPLVALSELTCRRTGCKLAFLSNTRCISKGKSGPLSAYMKMIDEKKVERNEKQVAALVKLQALHEAVVDFDTNPSKYTEVSYQFVDFSVKKQVVVTQPKGLYLYGGVGTGKTFLMDLFYEHVPVRRKRRIHFNNFMLDVHNRLHRLRKAGHRGDPLQVVTADLVKAAWLLCFDEFQVTDVADAMLMKSLFSGMLERGSVIVATSNRPPQDLYLNGLQRPLFLPFIELVKQRHDVHDIDSATDFRLVRRSYGEAADSYKVLPKPTGHGAQEPTRYEFKQIVRTISKGQEFVTVTLSVQGRKVTIPRAALSTRTADFTFQELCGQPLGAADYIALASAFSTLILTDVPHMTLNDANKLRRFITLVDCLYEARTRVFILAEAEPRGLFDRSANADSAQDEVFAFDRTASRLIEMQGQDYAQRSKRPCGVELVKAAWATRGHDDEQARDALDQVWRYYDLAADGQAWDGRSLQAFMEDVWEQQHTRREVPEAVLHAALASALGPNAPQTPSQTGSGVEIKQPGFLHLWNNDLVRLVRSPLPPAAQ